MNLFSKKIAMLTIFAMSATFLMSFEQKDADYGKATLVYDLNTEQADPQKVAISAWVRMAVRAVSHYTPEIEQMTYAVMGVKSDELPNDDNLKTEKLENLESQD